VALWHERDISHSSVERVILPDACLALDFALARSLRIAEGLVVFPDRMRRNLDAARGTVFSQAALLELIRGGMARDEAYRLVQASANEAAAGGRHLGEVLAGRVTDDAFSEERFVIAASAAVDHLATITTGWLQKPGTEW